MSSEPKSLEVLVIAGVVVKREGKYLLVQEKRPDVYGKWNLPAGRVDEGESLEVAAQREAKEETNLDVEIVKEVLLLHAFAESPVLHAFEAKLLGGELRYPPEEMLDAGWFTIDEVRQLDLRNPDYILGAIEAVENQE